MPEPVARVASSVVDSFKSQPLLLLVLVFNLAVLVIVFYGTRETHRNQAELLKTLIDRCVGK
jgi:hypothetical protein